MEYNKDDDSLISAVYTDSGDNVQEAFQGVEEDEEAFRREIQAERTRVMKEFGIFVPDNSEANDAISIASEGDDSIFAGSYNGILQQLEDKPTSNHKTSSTPETYDNVYDDHDDGNDDDSNSFRPKSLFIISPIESDNKQPSTYRELLTPGRLGIAILILSVIIVTAVAVAVGSFLANQNNDSPVKSGAELPDLGSLITPTVAPTISFEWKEGDCMDHPYKTFNVNERFGDQDCSFLQDHPGQRNRLCLPENEGYRWCPVTCGACQEMFGTSDAPSDVPSYAPSAVPSIIREPTEEPVSRPVADPTKRPIAKPVADPTRRPVAKPVSEPTRRPVAKPVSEPTRRPVAKPVSEPTRRPAPDPTRKPAPEPTRRPVAAPVVNPRPVAAPVANPRPVARPVPEPTRRPVAAPVPAPPTRSPVVKPVPSPVPPPVPVSNTKAPAASPPTVSTPKPTEDGDPPPFLCRVCRLQICEFLPC